MRKEFKTVISSIVSLIIAIVLFFGVSQHNIKKAERQNEIFAEGLSDMLRITEEMAQACRESRSKMMVYIVENKDSAKAAIEKVRGVCRYFENVKVPKALKTELEKVQGCIPDMRRFLDKYEEIFDMTSIDDLKRRINEMTDTLDALGRDGGFILAEQEFMRELEHQRLYSRKVFIWL